MKIACNGKFHTLGFRLLVHSSLNLYGRSACACSWGSAGCSSEPALPELPRRPWCSTVRQRQTAALAIATHWRRHAVRLMCARACARTHTHKHTHAFTCLGGRGELCTPREGRSRQSHCVYSKEFENAGF